MIFWDYNNLPPATLISGWCIPSYSLVQQVLPRVYWGYTTFTTKRAGPLTVGGAILLTRVLQVSTAIHSTFTGLRTTGRSLGICLRQARWCSSAVCHSPVQLPLSEERCDFHPNFREKWKTNKNICWIYPPSPRMPVTIRIIALLVGNTGIPSNLHLWLLPGGGG